uniref:TSA: Wollemia nobilis Ref_Wollemi_Transcript_10191_2140 transcribed RNA sequence n=1 Tax=Wollemia nobilis TaxID=56998 RepID=A0A0C9RMT8_9CONI
MAPVPSNNFGDLEFIMDANVRRVLSPCKPSSQGRLLSAPAALTRTQEEAPVPSDDVYPRSNPALIPIANAASISLALGSMLSANLLLKSSVASAPPARLQLALRPAAAAKNGPKPSSAAALKPKHPAAAAAGAAARLPQPLEIPAPPLPRRSLSSARGGTTAFPDYLRLRRGCRYAGDPASGGALRRAAVVWFRNDLRVRDNEALTRANEESVSVLPVYCFDPRDYGKSSSGFDKTGPYRATFLLECVAALREGLRERGSDLVVRVGKPEEVLVELAKSVGADAVYAHQEVSHEEIRAEEKVTAAFKEEGVEAKFFWGSTLYHLEDLPFKLDDMPSNYGGFREKVQSLKVRQTIQASKRFKGLPVRGNVEAGEIPSLLDLGLNPQYVKGQDGKAAASASLIGGEAEALKRLKTFATECGGQPNNVGKDGSADSLYGANFSCKISPWLAMGCLSPRHMFEELKKNSKRSISSSLGKTSGSGSDDGGLNWLMFELLWRDFFRFITKKYSSAKKRQDGVPASACTGAVAV